VCSIPFLISVVPLQQATDLAVTLQVGTGVAGLRRPNYGFQSACSNMVVKPERPGSDGVSKAAGYSEAVVFDAHQALPQWLIYFN